MKKRTKFAAILCSTSALLLSIGFLNQNISNAEASSQSKIIPYVPFLPIVSKGNAAISVTTAEQNMVEISPVLFGYLQQQNGQVVYFEKTIHQN
ncbi:hypothetical protein QNH48_14105 [Neobacillus sp. YX16]|uniref:hypothetical protein n=1 Tax=Neobacillus sp. YX16 TaxID=3047874 RepID=UPI0024C217AF|nr:hypothetical protein [Neobacillus sp. YX16]WHZ05687.1 hypothetical protein QNH48_14105 [Neobacillus sp. YX16]